MIRTIILLVLTCAAALPAPAQTAGAGEAELDNHAAAVAGSALTAPTSPLFRAEAALPFRLAAPDPGIRRDSVPAAPIDLRIATRVRASNVQQNTILRGVARVFDTAAVPGTLLLAGALYGAGELRDDPALADLGLDTAAAIVAAGAASVAGKVAVGRARPHVSPQDPHDLAFGRGLLGDDYQSFPSAHTAIAFATAAVLAADLPDYSTGDDVWIGPASFGSASIAGVSRLYYDEHWATDVIAGAVLGTLVGFVAAN